MVGGTPSASLPTQKRGEKDPALTPFGPVKRASGADARYSCFAPGFVTAPFSAVPNNWPYFARTPFV